MRRERRPRRQAVDPRLVALVNTFDEGFDTVDLREARAVLGQQA